MRNLARIVVPFALGITACVREPIEWGEISYRRSRLGDPDTRSWIRNANLPVIPGTAGACRRSIRVAGDSSDLFRIWFSSRPDSSVLLSMQRSKDQGRTWLAPLVVDSTDRGRRGCDRPAPATVFEPVSGYLYLVYFIESQLGAGVFFAHSMDRGEMFHSPVPVIYGKRPSAAHVAGRGDSVVVVFEDPNSSQSLVGYALSHTNGHIFEQRGRVTPSEEVATGPWAALEGDKVTVWWKSGDRSATSSPDTDRVGFRSGVWK